MSSDTSVTSPRLFKAAVAAAWPRCRESCSQRLKMLLRFLGQTLLCDLCHDSRLVAAYVRDVDDHRVAEKRSEFGVGRRAVVTLKPFGQVGIGDPQRFLEFTRNPESHQVGRVLCADPRGV